MELNSVTFLFFIVFYFIGSIPFALIVHKFMSTADPRKSGSMNPGATNMYRLAGPLPGILTFLGDFSKGFVPVYFLVGQNMTAAYICSLFLLFGHMFSVFNNFKGGKGVATSFGFILALDFQIGLVVLMTWVIIFALKRISGLSAVVSFIFLPVIIFFISNNQLLFLISIFHSVIILINHRKNIKEILEG
tara:strand:+ start:106 stop:675 length:570 start_codon:yes stop_codon:yes gene_type:complete